jgi:hypothetical protein
MFKEYDVVALKKEVAGIPLATGTEGTVLLVYLDGTAHYEIEFTDGKGKLFLPHLHRFRRGSDSRLGI